MPRRSSISDKPAETFAHKLVAETAKELMHELYDQLMKDDVLFRAWKAQNPGLGPKALEVKFVNSKWREAIRPARATLAVMLRNTQDESLKNTIYDALIKDATLTHGRT